MFFTCFGKLKFSTFDVYEKWLYLSKINYMITLDFASQQIQFNKYWGNKVLSEEWTIKVNLRVEPQHLTANLQDDKQYQWQDKD